MAANLADIALGSFAGVRGLRQQRFDNSAKTRQLGQVDREQTQRDRTQDQRDRELGQADTQLTINERIVKVSESAETRAVNVANIEALTTGNDQYIDSLNSAGLLSPDMLSLDQDKIRAGIQSGDATVSSVALDIITNSGELPEGSVASKIQPLEGGGYAVTVTNADGSIGALTEDGSSNPDSKVINFEVGKLANLGNLYYQKNVVNDSTLLSPTRIRAELNRVGTDAERNEILKKYERIQQQSDVLDSVPKEGGASRQIAGVIASATDGSETDDILSTIADDVNPDANKVKQRGKVDEQPYPFWEKRGDNAAPDNAPAAPADNSAELKRLDTQISAAEKRLSSAPPLMKPAARQRVDMLKEKRQSLAPQEEVFPIQITESPLAQSVDGKTSAEVDAGIESGEIKATNEEAQIVAQSMKDKDITSLAEMLRLNDKERAVARAVIISMEEDPVRRRAMSDEINNIFETSAGYASVTKKDELTLDYNNRKLTQDKAKFAQTTRQWMKGEYDSAVEDAAAWTAVVNKVWYGEDGSDSNLNAKTARMVFRGHLPAMMVKAKMSSSPEEARVRFKAMGGVVGSAVAAMAQEDEGGFLETFISFFRGEAEDNVTAMDFDLSRVVPGEIEKGKITTYYYLDAQGNRTSEAILASELAALDSEVEKIVREAAIYNDKNKG